MQLLEWSKQRFVVLIYILLKAIHQKYHQTQHGHEGIGIVESVGSSVNNFKVGDKVIVSCISSCGKCYYCKKVFMHIEKDGGWILGHLIDGTQAEYVKVLSQTTLYTMHQNLYQTEALVMLSDILPTGYEIGVLKVKLNQVVRLR